MFDINNHIAKIADSKIEAVIKPAFIFFENTPYYQISNFPQFEGAGVYALFLKSTINTCYHECLPAMYPIYIGKAAPSGSRQGKKNTVGKTLRNRLQKHLRSIEQAENLNTDDFLCRFMIFQNLATDMISAMESYLIRQYNPLWNSYIDGFGINAPGAGRYNQSPSEWDTLHPGRYYAKQLTGEPRNKAQILTKLQNYPST
ncbi:MAG: Eco29kI family restriction endonuclease [Methylococcaceae bacterium]|nr:Eco29kI family restriction endonuclease [Methylococcaceae bacterium]